MAVRPSDRGEPARWRCAGSVLWREVTAAEWIASARAAAILALASLSEPDWEPTTSRPGGRAPAAAPADAVTAAFEAYQVEIYSFAVHSTRDPDVAADVVQEAFLKLLREAREERLPDNTRAWLYRVTTNLIINRAKHLAVVDRVRRAWRRDEELVESPELRTIRAEQTATLLAALAELPSDARTALLLAAQGFSGREVAEAIGRTELATRTLLCRARLRMREHLTGEPGSGPDR